MKSPLLADKLREIFGAEGEAALMQMLALARKGHPELVDGVAKLLDVSDGLVAHHCQGLRPWRRNGVDQRSGERDDC